MNTVGTKALALTLVLAALFAAGTGRADAQRRKAPAPKHSIADKFLQYEVVNGDTVYLDILNPSRVSTYGGARKGREWRRYYRLVWNFSKTYPYALVAGRLVAKADSTFAEDNYGRRQKEKYVSEVQKELFNAYEEPLRHMTVSQGQLLMKLIDREVGKSSFAIIKDYKNGIAAGFWQGVAKIFGSDLKKHYDPEGEDAAVEELVGKWNSGEFNSLYFSLFGEYPTKVEVPSKYI